MPAIKTCLSIQDCHEVLKAHTTPGASASLFAREIHYPDAVVLVEGDRIQVEQRKSYFNPWSLHFKASLKAVGPQSTVIEGDFQERPVLKHLKFVSGIGMTCAIGLVANIIRQVLYTPIASHDVKMILAGEAVFLAVLTVANAIAIRWCEKRYGQLAVAENHFVLEFLQKTLHAQLVEPMNQLDIDDPDDYELAESA